MIDACVANNVPRLVLTSTVDVVVGYDDIIDGDETLPEPRHFLFPGYPDTKNRAEKMVLSANGTQLSNGINTVYILLVPLFRICRLNLHLRLNHASFCLIC